MIDENIQLEMAMKPKFRNTSGKAIRYCSTMEAYCPNCGKTIPEYEQERCENCGIKLNWDYSIAWD